jgi:uroporphyrinogen-III decarboxylase
MTNRERLLSLLRGEPADRVPCWLLFPYHKLGCYADVRNEPTYRSVFEASRRQAMMLNRRTLRAGSLYTPDVQTRRERVTEDGWKIERDHVEYRDVHLVAEKRTRPGEVRIKKLIDTEEDLLAFSALPFNTDRAAIQAELSRQLPVLRAEQAEFPMEYGAMMLSQGEPIGDLYSQANLTEYPVWSLTQPVAVKRLLETLMIRYRHVYEFCLAHELAEVYFMVGSELASPPMFSRATFQEWVVPYARELIAMAHSAGCHVIQHYHGQIREILPDFLTMGADALHTIEAPPVGNCTFTQAFDVVGDRLTLIGNVQYDRFRSCQPGEMREEVRQILAECRGRRLILSPSAGPYEPVISETMIRNYHAFLDAAWEFGGRT